MTDPSALTPPSAALPTAAPEPSSGRRLPSRWQSIRLLAAADLDAVARSWLCRGFLLASGLLTVLEFKGLQAEQKVASQMLEVVYSTYLVVWMHGVIFIAGAALAREADCLNDGILCRGVTRGEYLAGKLAARCLAILITIGGVLLPTSFWAIRQDTLVRTDTGYVGSVARNTKVEAWEPRKVFAQVGGTVRELSLQVGDFVHAGDVLTVLDDRAVFDELEHERRSEENARNEVNNARRRAEEAKRAVAQAEDALARAERGVIGKDLLSALEQADRETELRSRKRDLKNAESAARAAEDAIPAAERAVENAVARVREARRRLGHTSVTAPISGYVTELLAHPAQYVSVGGHLCTLAPLDEYQVRVPVYKFDEFKRLKPGLAAYIQIEHTEYKGVIDRLGATTQPDRWGRDSNYAVVRFQGGGALGLLGLPADVRLVLPPPPEAKSRAADLLNLLTGGGEDDLESRTGSVTTGWMLIALGKVIGCACLLVTLTLATLALVRNPLTAVLAVTGLWHVSNLLFDFVGLRELSYLEMVRNLDKVLGGVAQPTEELTTLAWLFGLATGLGALAIGLFIARDPPR
ncbi:MAG: HlyD family efflux transporter periplasmic adaptor subunit [Verrucomicrobia bacterium]|nr:HlyD family efflux transporter periplasmic adaptor subunit [Verrucomicrobiota bacterium]